MRTKKTSLGTVEFSIEQGHDGDNTEAWCPVIIFNMPAGKKLTMVGDISFQHEDQAKQVIMGVYHALTGPQKNLTMWPEGKISQ